MGEINEAEAPNEAEAGQGGGMLSKNEEAERGIDGCTGGWGMAWKLTADGWRRTGG